MGNLKSRLLFFIQETKLTRSEFERRTCLANGYINNFKGSMGSEKLEKILIEFPELNVRWLLLGEGEMIKPKLGTISEEQEQIILKTLSEYHQQHPDGVKDMLHEYQLLKLEKELKAKFDAALEKKDEQIGKFADILAEKETQISRLTAMLESVQKKHATAAECADAKQVG